MTHHELTEAQRARFWRDGYLIIEDFLPAEANARLLEAARTNAAMQSAARDVRDAKDRATNMAVWNEAGDDIFGVFARSELVVASMETLLGDEI